MDKRDTLSRELTAGVFLACDSLHDSYNLDEPLLSRITLENKSNKEGLYIFIGSYPPFTGWSIFNSSDERVSGGPTVVGLAEFRDTLNVGEKLVDKFIWHHQISDPNEMYSGLKAFSGKYKLRIGFWGIPNSLNPYLIKYFEITEIGEHLSYNLYRYYDQSDSVNFDFVLRNRITKNIILTRSEIPSYIYLYNEARKDTVYKYSFTPEKQSYILNGHSDNILARYRNSKKYFKDLGITGAFKFIIKMNFAERVVTTENLLFIL